MQITSYRKLLTIFCSFVLAVFGLTFYYVRLQLSDMNREILARAYDNVSLFTTFVDERFTSTVYNVILVSHSSAIREMETTDLTQQRADGAFLLQTLQLYQSANRYVTDIGIYITKPRMLLHSATGLSVLAADDPMLHAPAVPYQFINQRNGRTFLLFTDGKQAPPKLPDAPVFSAITIDQRLLLSELSRNLPYASSVLFAKDGTRIASSIKDSELEQAVHALHDERTHPTITVRTLRLHGVSYGVVSSPIHALGTTAYAVFRMDDVSLYASTYRDLFWIVLILLVGFSVLFIHSSRKWIHTPLRQLIEGFGQIHQGNLEYRIDTRQPNEFGYLMDEFNHMAAGLADSISRYTKQQLALKKAELQQLQLQVKPHFLYNCFYNINSLCTARDYARIKDLTRHLASFYAYATHGDVFEATLMQEYGYAADYLAIQHIRFGDRVHVAVESLPACVEALPVPMFILQPIIENAFKHGCEAHEGEAHICWRTQVVGRMLRIQVENSGDGNVTPILAHIEALLASSETERISGLVNVSRRLRLFFEDRADLRFTEGALGGLCVTLTLRLEKETTA